MFAHNRVGSVTNSNNIRRHGAHGKFEDIVRMACSKGRGFSHWFLVYVFYSVLHDPQIQKKEKHVRYVHARTYQGACAKKDCGVARGTRKRRREESMKKGG